MCLCWFPDTPAHEFTQTLGYAGRAPGAAQSAAEGGSTGLPGGGFPAGQSGQLGEKQHETPHPLRPMYDILRNEAWYRLGERLELHSQQQKAAALGRLVGTFQQAELDGLADDACPRLLALLQGLSQQPLESPIPEGGGEGSSGGVALAGELHPCYTTKKKKRFKGRQTRV